jgi:hypothetical protein
MMKGFDCAAVATSYARQVADAGYQFFARYYRRTLVSRWAVSPDEAKAMFDAGLWMLSVFQNTSNVPSYFTVENAVADVNAALAKADQMGQPEGSAIYFAVDCNPGKGPELDAVKRYFERVMGAVTIGGYRAGVYGSGLVLDTILSANLAECGWLANATGWWGTKGYDGWAVKQTSLPKKLPFGLEVDDNEARDTGRAGLWRLGGGKGEASLVEAGR